MSALGLNWKPTGIGACTPSRPRIVTVPEPEFATSPNAPSAGSIATPRGAGPTGMLSTFTNETSGPGTNVTCPLDPPTIWYTNTMLPSVLVT